MIQFNNQLYIHFGSLELNLLKGLSDDINHVEVLFAIGNRCFNICIRQTVQIIYQIDDLKYGTELVWKILHHLFR